MKHCLLNNKKTERRFRLDWKERNMREVLFVIFFFFKFPHPTPKFLVPTWQISILCHFSLHLDVTAILITMIACYDSLGQYWVYPDGNALICGEQGWRSGESTRIPPMWPGFDSRTRRHMWAELVVGSRPCSERFFSGYSGFPLSSKNNTSKFQFDLESVPN